jgi:hypothetical protein
MSQPLVDRIPFARILIGLAIVFAISLGLCGLTARAVLHGRTAPSGLDLFLEKTAVYDLLGMLLSAAGVLITCVVWIVMSVVSRARNKEESS